MLAEYDFHGAALEGEAKKHKHLAKIDEVFQNMRETVKTECEETTKMIHSRFDKLENLMDKSLLLLYSKASSSVKKRLESHHHRLHARIKKLQNEAAMNDATGPDQDTAENKERDENDIEEEMNTNESQSEGESGDLALNEAEEDFDDFL